MSPENETPSPPWAALPDVTTLPGGCDNLGTPMCTCHLAGGPALTFCTEMYLPIQQLPPGSCKISVMQCSAIMQLFPAIMQQFPSVPSILQAVLEIRI